jgi:recombinational DNA repair protein (RecF pathway)
MHEFVTNAFVLGRRPRGELDLTVDLYTERIGRIEGRVISGQKITSKFSPHLIVPNFVTIRVVEKNVHTITDVISFSSPWKFKDNADTFQNIFRIFFLLRVAAPLHVPDQLLWKYISCENGEKPPEIDRILNTLGYDISLATCAVCAKRPVHFFEYGEGSFLCDVCGVKPHHDRVILVV